MDLIFIEELLHVLYGIAKVTSLLYEDIKRMPIDLNMFNWFGSLLSSAEIF